MAVEMAIVQSQRNPGLVPGEVVPTDPEENEAGAKGAGEPEAPKLNDGVTIPEGFEDQAPGLSGDQDSGNDSEYIDEILYPNPDGFPTDAEMVSPNYFDDEELKNRVPQTKILQATVPVGAFGGGAAFDPVMLFPPDSNRKELVLRAVSSVASTWRFGSDKQSCYTAASLSTSDQPVVLQCHTGPVWVYSSDTTNAFVVNGWAVTK